MIATIFSISLWRLRNNTQEMVLLFVVPIAFFSIFALIFKNGIGNGMQSLHVAVIDDGFSELSKSIVKRLRETDTLEIEAETFKTADQWPLERLTQQLIRQKRLAAAVYLPKELDAKLAEGTPIHVRVFCEGSNPIANQVIASVLREIIMPLQAAKRSERESTPHQAMAGVASDSPKLPRPNGPPPTPSTTPSTMPSDSDSALEITSENVFDATKSNPTVAMYAAGIAVMFLLFSATGAAGGLLDEREAGTLDRLLASRLSVTQLLAGKWLYITFIGCLQLTVMFIFAQIAFGVELTRHLPGFAVMALFTAAATSSLAIFLASLCKTRNQLSGVSVVLILAMSALGGSMVPRYIMSESMQRLGYLTFNAWALDGFNKIFWHELPVSEITRELTVLFCVAFYFALAARMLVGKMESD